MSDVWPVGFGVRGSGRRMDGAGMGAGSGEADTIRLYLDDLLS